MSVPRMPIQRTKAPKHHHLCPNYGHGPARTCIYCERLNKPKQRYYAVADDLK